MTRPMLPRLGAACGIVFPIAMLLAVGRASVAVIAFRERVLPRWLGTFAAVTAVALAVNAGFVYASFVPALLLFLLWTLFTSMVLLRRSWSTQARVAYST